MAPGLTHTYYFWRLAGMVGSLAILGMLVLDLIISPLLMVENHSAYLVFTVWACFLVLLAAHLQSAIASPIILLLAVPSVAGGIMFATFTTVSFLSDVMVCTALSDTDIDSGHNCYKSSGAAGDCSVSVDTTSELSSICLEFHYGSSKIGLLSHVTIGLTLFVTICVLLALAYVFYRDTPSLVSMTTAAAALLVSFDGDKQVRTKLRDALMASHDYLQGNTRPKTQ